MSSAQRSPTIDIAFATGQYWSNRRAIAAKHSDFAFSTEARTCKKKGTTIVSPPRASQTKERSPDGCDSPQVVRPCSALHRPVHGRPRHRGCERRAAVDPDRPRVLAGEPPVGDQRLRPPLRRVPAARRPRPRPPRAPAAPRPPPPAPRARACPPRRGVVAPPPPPSPPRPRGGGELAHRRARP